MRHPIVFASMLALAVAGCGDSDLTPGPPAESTATSSANIVATAESAGQFTTLIAALKAAGLTETLKSEGPFTVFAPTDNAFAELPPGTLDTLLQPENADRLRAVLTYHVVPGRVGAADAAKLSTAKTVNGQEVDIATSEGGLTVDGARVVRADIAASNGIIHVIDAVIVPQ